VPRAEIAGAVASRYAKIRAELGRHFSRPSISLRAMAPAGHIFSALSQSLTFVCQPNSFLARRRYRHVISDVSSTKFLFRHVECATAFAMLLPLKLRVYAFSAAD